MDRKRKALCVDMLFSSSSDSSSSSDDDSPIVLLEKHKKSKIENFEEVISQFTDLEFKQHFRLSRDSFRKIKDLFEESVHYPKERTNNRCDLTSASLSILSFLRYAGNKCCIRDVANRFNLAESTLHRVMTNVMDFLVEIAPQIIKFPATEEEKRNLADEFKNDSGFPDVIGCIDGTYIPIRTPNYKIKSTYINRHDLPAITVQAICSHNRSFMDVFTGTPSKIHDARVFKLSFIAKKLPAICEGGKWHILGDAAYPIKKWLLTPFRDYGTLTPAQKNYNKKFSQTRVKIENAFGILKSRFRQLIRTDFMSVERTCRFILSCCVLHNLCIKNNDEWCEYEDDKNGDNLSVREYVTVDTETIEKRDGEEKRNLLCTLLSQ